MSIPLDYHMSDSQHTFYNKTIVLQREQKVDRSCPLVH